MVPVTSLACAVSIAWETIDTGPCQWPQPKIEVKSEMSVQANDYEIERATGVLPARKRYIPLKYRDFKSSIVDSDEDAGDADYDPDPQPQAKEPKVKRARGRPKKSCDGQDEETDERAPSSVNYINKSGMQKTRKGYKCLTCNKVFAQKGNLKVHFLTHTGERPWPCDVENCDKKFRTFETLRRHKMSQHLGIKPFECTECKKKFCSALSLQEHMSLHTNLKPYSCSECQRTFRQISCLRRHLITHSSDLPHACEICGKKFSQAVYLRSHLKMHTGEKPFSCEQCQKTFAHASDLNRHKIIHSGTKPYACNICNLSFNDPSSRRRHEREHAVEKAYKCHLCSDSFKRQSNLKVHLFRRHDNNKEPHVLDENGQIIAYRCSLCFEVYKHQSSLQTHLTYRHGNAQEQLVVEGNGQIITYKCNLCSEVFKQQSHLQAHLITCHGHSQDLLVLEDTGQIVTYKCNLCSEVFKQQSTLQSHFISHHSSIQEEVHVLEETGQTVTYKCNLCSEVFKQQSTLHSHFISHHSSIHEDVHVVEENGQIIAYKCHMCSEVFKQQSELRVHVFRDHGNVQEDLRVLDENGQMVFSIEVHSDGNSDASTSSNNLTKVDLSALNLSDLDQQKILDLIGKVQGNVIVRVAGAGDTQVVTDTSLLGQEVSIMGDLEVVSTSDLEQLGPPLEVTAGLEGVPKEVGEQEVGQTYAVVDGEVGGQAVQEGTEVGHTYTVIHGESGDVHSLQDMGHTYTVLQQENVGGSENLRHMQHLQQQQPEMYEVHYQPASDQHTVLTPTTVNATAAITSTVFSATPVSETVISNSSTAQLSNIPQSIVTAVATSTSTPTSGTETVAPLATAVAMENTVMGAAALQAVSVNGGLPAELKAQFVDKPDLSSQEYYDWLSSFTEVCKQFSVPLEVEVFRKISQVHKTLSDFMASPSGVISDRNNFAILMSISRDLNTILGEHLNCMLNNLSK